ncbi:MAG TPA: prephenate dehydrogenase/arogenate dehydrogenase family protein [Acidimicrobiales bacterium]|nr:prephenate dehydrogenase/arogenate dehydrogenase family protein [Acidimicrobiales bacterium]
MNAPRRANVVGLGLIGCSLAMALRERGWHVTGSETDPDRLAQAQGRGAVDAIGLDPEAEITWVAVPASATVPAVKEVLASTAGLVTDVASVKGPIVDQIDDPRYLGGHPMAGSDLDGPAGADPDMFVGAVWVLTPTSDTSDEVFAGVAGAIRSLDAEVVAVPAARHDAMVAVVSHVPHLTAATLMTIASARATDHAALLRLAAGGFRDMTRIAAGPPAIWPDICVENREAIVDVLDLLMADLATVRDLVSAEDRGGLLDLLSRARSSRRSLPAGAAHPSQLSEARIPIPDRPGAAAEVFTLAAELGVNVSDFEVYHSAEGDRGVMIAVIESASADLFRGGLIARGFKPGIRSLD